MEQQSLNFDRFKFDATPYIIAANSFSKQFKENESENSGISKEAFDQLDFSIADKLNECSKRNEDLKAIQAENLKIQTELNILKCEEDQQTRSGFDLKNGIHKYEICN